MVACEPRNTRDKGPSGSTRSTRTSPSIHSMSSIASPPALAAADDDLEVPAVRRYRSHVRRPGSPSAFSRISEVHFAGSRGPRSPCRGWWCRRACDQTANDTSRSEAPTPPATTAADSTSAARRFGPAIRDAHPGLLWRPWSQRSPLGARATGTGRAVEQAVAHTAQHDVPEDSRARTNPPRGSGHRASPRARAARQVLTVRVPDEAGLRARRISRPRLIERGVGDLRRGFRDTPRRRGPCPASHGAGTAHATRGRRPAVRASIPARSSAALPRSVRRVALRSSSWWRPSRG